MAHTGFANLSDVEDAYDDGRVTYTGFRKRPVVTTTANFWFDLAGAGGLPTPFYYASTPNTWVALKQSTEGGVYHGGNVSPKIKCLKSIMVAASAVTTATPLPMMMLDYLGYWPFIDESGSVELVGSGITRHTDGVGVQAMAVVAAPHTTTATFNLTYTNQAGTSGRTSATVACGSQVVNGTIISSGNNALGGPLFIPLQAGDTGIRSVQNVNWIVEDVGLIHLVLVKPVASFALDSYAGAAYSPTERDYALHSFGTLPVIEDDAYLNFICLPSGTIALSVIHGMVETIWSR